MKNKYKNIKFISLPTSKKYNSSFRNNTSNLYDKLIKEFNFIKIKKKPLNIEPIVKPIDDSFANKGFILFDKNYKKNTFMFKFEKNNYLLTNNKDYNRILTDDTFKEVIVNKAKGGKFRIFDFKKAKEIFQDFISNDVYFDKFRDDKYYDFCYLKI